METIETKIGIIHAGFGQLITYYDLIFTPSRIVFSKTGRWGVWAIILGPIGMLMALNIRNKKQEELANESIVDILNLSEDNYAISYTDIKSIAIKKIMGGKKLEIITDKETKTFTLFGKKTAVPNKDQINEYENIIKRAIPDNIKS
jgi:hypothetical protein